MKITCPNKLSKHQTCTGSRANGTIICNALQEENVIPALWRNCSWYYRMCELKNTMPQLWEPGGVCCKDYRYLMLETAETNGYYATAVDIRKYPNDGKDVWRNYHRIRFRFCPFCGASLNIAVANEGET